MEKIRVESEWDGERIDLVLAGFFDDRSRSFFQKLIRDSKILLDGKSVKASTEVHEQQEITIDFPELETLNIEPENIPLDIVYEDSDLLVVNKPAGMVVHPAVGHYEGTLVNALLYHCRDLSGINGILRPGIVHRIDKDTSGLLLVCKNDFTHQKIAEQLKEHSIERKYIALVRGNVKDDEGTVDAPLGRSKTDRKKMAIRPDGKEAVTHYHVLARNGSETLLECRLETGRTHQIRVHMSSIGHPLYHDPVYGIKKDEDKEGQFLHAASLGFLHPTKNEWMRFEKELPEDKKNILKILKFDL